LENGKILIRNYCNIPEGRYLSPSFRHDLRFVRTSFRVSYQRTQYKLLKERKASQLSVHRIKLLESIGFVWVVRDPDEQVPWMERLEQMKKYKAEYGTCLVPRSYSANPKLGKWVHYQVRPICQ